MVDLIRKPARCLGLCLAYNVIPRGFLWDRFCKSDYFVFRHDTFTKCSSFKWLKLAIKDIFQNNARSMTENIYQRLPCAQIAIKTKKNNCHCFSFASCGHKKLPSTVWTSIRYVIFHLTDRRGVASLRHRNRAKITVFMCERKPYLVRFSRRRKKLYFIVWTQT